MSTSIYQLHLTKFLQTGLDQLHIVQDPDTDHASGKVLQSFCPAYSYIRSIHKHLSFSANLLPKDAFSARTNCYIRLEHHMMLQPAFDWAKGGKLGGLFNGTKCGSNAGCSSLKETYKRELDKRLPDAMFQLEKKHFDEVRVP
ncbi:hypothetical protein BGZ93_004816 [Podila epicladia]|nr:hypothetical protein BGZ92_011261 [Podila epicladia]KAG0096256.1 hypothetical protein BGZ93_004816 [Podila epicladia]